MRWQKSIANCVSILTTIAATFVFEATIDAQEQFPYSATIQSDSASIHSGPAKIHYMTCRLKQGERVQIYRHDPGGWLAIRPTENDFSLVRAKHVLANFSKGTGKITQDSVRSWVGTESTDDSEPMWQIQFRKGDRVKLKGKQQIEDTNGELHSWYEIAPPSGEFRWLHESAIRLEQTKPAQSANKSRPSKQSPVGTGVARSLVDSGAATSGAAMSGTPTTNEQATPNAKWSEADASDTDLASHESNISPRTQLANNSENKSAPEPFQPEKLTMSDDGKLFESRQQNLPPGLPGQNTDSTYVQSLTDDNRESNKRVGWQVASASSASSAISPSLPHTEPEPVHTSHSLHEPNRLGDFDSQPAIFPKDNNTRQSSTPLKVSGKSFADKIRTIEIAFTNEVVKPADQWQLAAFRDAVMKLSTNAKLSSEQNSVNKLLEKLKSFERLQSRRNALNETHSKVSSASKKIAERQSNVKQVGMVETTSNNLLDAVKKTSSARNSSANAKSDRSVGTDVAKTKTEKKTEKKTDSNAPLYDAKGWLSRLYTNNGTGQSGYVVQDSSGNILSTILPAPGVNLDRYLDQEVGIVGRRGFNRKYNKPHVTANRVIRLDRHR